MRDALKNPADDVDACPICDKPFQPEDLCSNDIELGCCHALCLVGADVVDLDTGEPMPDGEVAVYFYREVME